MAKERIVLFPSECRRQPDDGRSEKGRTRPLNGLLRASVLDGAVE